MNFNLVTPVQTKCCSKRTKIVAFIIFLIIWICCVILYFYLNQKKYVLVENKLLFNPAVYKEKFESPIKMIYIDDFLGGKSSKMNDQQTFVKVNYHFVDQSEIIYEDFGFNIMPYNYETDKSERKNYRLK